MALIQDITGVNTLAISTSGHAFVVDAKFPTAAAAADGYANPTITHEGADGMLYNGSTWDRARNNFVTIADASAARTSTVAGGTTVTNFNAKGAVITINVTAVSGTSPTLVAKLQYSPDGGTTWIDYTNKPVTATISAIGQTTLIVCPGVTEVANSAVSLPLPRTVRMYYTIAGTTPSFTFATYFNWIL
jgi:hypothetical protein